MRDNALRSSGDGPAALCGGEAAGPDKRAFGGRSPGWRKTCAQANGVETFERSMWRQFRCVEAIRCAAMGQHVWHRNCMIRSGGMGWRPVASQM